jgi:hypothetical protein
MALAGPSVSILLGGVFMLLWLVTGRGNNATSIMWEWLWIMNIGLGIFNLAPAFPMDGGRVLRASLWGVTRNFNRATRIAVWVGRALAVSLIGLGLLVALRVGVFDAVDSVSGIWFVFIGWFLLQNANGSLRQVALLDELRGYRAGAVMVRDIPTAYPSTTVRGLLLGPLAGYGAGKDWLFVSDGSRFLGVISRLAVLRVPEERWDTMVAADLMTPAAALRPISPDDTLADVLQQIQEHDVHLFPVVTDGEVTGLVHEGIISRIMRR